MNDTKMGLFGTITNLMAFGISHMNEIKDWLQVASLLFGIVCAILTITSFFKNKNKKKGKDNETID
jgi:hypothetical protein